MHDSSLKATIFFPCQKLGHKQCFYIVHFMFVVNWVFSAFNLNIVVQFDFVTIIFLKREGV